MFIVNLFVAAHRGFAEWRRRHQAYAELMALDDRSLADIGIRRSEIPGIIERSHGSAGSGHKPQFGFTSRHARLAGGINILPPL
jgi:uncharacterized protein YjiS (DUF1127 family)